MQVKFDGFPGHTGAVGFRLPDGTLAAEIDPAATPVGYRATCSCGWVGETDHPPTQEGGWLVSSEWGQSHMKPLWATTPPGWLLNRSDTLRDNLAELATTWPLQALAVLAAVERWQRPLIEEAVVAARAAGTSWADIGAALGVTRQSAHERFSAAVRRRSAS